MTEPQSFSALTEYKAPAIPATKIAAKYWQKTKSLLMRDNDQPYMPSDQLAYADATALRHFFPVPSYQLLLDELSATLTGHLDTKAPHPVFWLCMPAGNPDLLAAWAEAQGYGLLSPPPRKALLDRQSGFKLSAQQQQSGVLVVPELEQWFLRHHQGVRIVRDTISQLLAHDGPIVLGGNGFALMLLQQLCSDQDIWPKALTFRPFKTDRLYPWLYRNIYKGETRTFVIKESFSGKDLFGETIADPIPARSLFNRLAADSLGIPWLAWHILTSSLKTRKQVEEGEPSIRDSSAELWLHTVPTRNEQALRSKNAKFILHAIAIHGTLTREELLLVLPSQLAALTDLCLEGYLLQEEDSYRINPLCYAAIYHALKSAGMSCPPL